MAHTSMSAGSATETLARLAQSLACLLVDAWRRGWQPADLHSYVSKHWDALSAAVLRDAMAADIGRYAPRTVDDRWHSQLEELGATRWWPADSDHLTARAARTTGGAAGVRAACGILTLALDRLPEIEVIGPLPGAAHTDPSERRAADVDRRLLAKVRMMLAKAESTPYEPEAEAFTAAAHSLMARHSIDRALLDAVAAPAAGDGPRATRVHIPSPYARDKLSLLTAVAQANRCKAVWFEHFGFATVVGFEVDLRAVELLFASLLVQANVAMRATQPGRDASGTKVFRRSFLRGFTQRIAERLTAETRSQTAAASAEHRLAAGSGARATDLVRVLGDRDRAVADSVRERYPHLQSMRSRGMLDPDGWHSGRAAADRARFGDPVRIGGDSR